jgi:hypothetical protein
MGASNNYYRAGQKKGQNYKGARSRKADPSQMAITRRGVKFLIIGLLVMVAGYILMMGGGSKDPQTFNYAMFDFRRLVAAPIVIICGVIIEIVGIMGFAKDRNAAPEEGDEDKAIKK